MGENTYDILLNKYDSYDAQYIFDMYYNLLYRFAGSILNISDRTKESVLDLYYDISTCFLLMIMSKDANNDNPEIVEQNKNVYEDISYIFVNYSNEPITMDELKMISLKAKISVTKYLRETNDLYEHD